MSRSNLLVAILVTVATLSLAPSAAAHYNPTKGRWIERDPVGYRDSPSLYQALKSQPLRRIDPTGLASLTASAVSAVQIQVPEGPSVTPVIPPLDGRPFGRGFESPVPFTPMQLFCCKEARKRDGASAETVCCEGRKIICVFVDAADEFPALRLPGKGYDLAQEIINRCTVRHERWHAESQDWLSCNNVPDGMPPTCEHCERLEETMRSRCDHCDIYQDEVACLTEGKRACLALPPLPRSECQRAIDRAIRNALGQAARHCPQ